jgi:hypothetical protein
MNIVLSVCVCAALGNLGTDNGGSFAFQPEYVLDRQLRGPARAYTPQPGDIFLGAQDDFWSVFGDIAAGTGFPNHCSIVFVHRDGTLAILEAGREGRLRDGMAIIPLRETML